MRSGRLGHSGDLRQPLRARLGMGGGQNIHGNEKSKTDFFPSVLTAGDAGNMASGIMEHTGRRQAL